MRTRDADGRIRQLDAPLALADDRRCQRALTLAPDAALAAGEWQLSACAPATIRRTPGI